MNPFRVLAVSFGVLFATYIFLIAKNFRKLLPQLHSAITRSRQQRLVIEVSALEHKEVLGRARAGDPEAQYAAGRFFAARGSHKRAAMWFRRAADAGILDAQYCLGVTLENGRGVARDFQAAFGWYERAAQLGHTMSQYNLGLALLRGNGVSQNWVAAAYWLLQAAMAESSNANVALDWIVSNDSNRPASSADDLKPFVARASMHDSDAKFLVAWCHEVGFVLPIDRRAAHQWYAQAAEDGHLKGRERADRLR